MNQSKRNSMAKDRERGKQYYLLREKRGSE